MGDFRYDRKTQVHSGHLRKPSRHKQKNRCIQKYWDTTVFFYMTHLFIATYNIREEFLISLTIVRVRAIALATASTAQGKVGTGLALFFMNQGRF